MKQLDHRFQSVPSAPPPPRPRPVGVRSPAKARRASAAPSAHTEGVYPCPFGFALNVALHRAERLVPVLADNAALLAPVAEALALVRDSGGFEAKGVRLPTAEVRLVFDGVPDLPRATRRIQALAGDLLAFGIGELQSSESSLAFQPALELRAPTPRSLSVHLYLEGTSAAHERLLGRLAERLRPAFGSLIEAQARAETHFILRRRVLARCRVDLARLLSRLPGRAMWDPNRDAAAIGQALRWLDAAQAAPVLASAQNELVLGAVARVARALGIDARRLAAEGQCHAARFGAVAPLAAFALDGGYLAGLLELPIGIEARRRDAKTDLAYGLMQGDSSEDIGLLSTCLGLAAHLATVKAALSLALAGLAAAPGRVSSLPACSFDLERTIVTPARRTSAAAGSVMLPPPPHLPPSSLSSPARRPSPRPARGPSPAPTNRPSPPSSSLAWPARASSLPPPRESMVVARPAPPMSSSSPQLAASTLPPARRSDHASGIHPSTQVRRSPPPLRRSRQERG
jgi:hypothetical protein